MMRKTALRLNNNFKLPANKHNNKADNSITVLIIQFAKQLALIIEEQRPNIPKIVLLS